MKITFYLASKVLNTAQVLLKNDLFKFRKIDSLFLLWKTSQKIIWNSHSSCISPWNCHSGIFQVPLIGILIKFINVVIECHSCHILRFISAQREDSTSIDGCKLGLNGLWQRWSGSPLHFRQGKDVRLSQPGHQNFRSSTHIV